MRRSLAVAFIFSSFFTYAQLNEGGVPYSFRHELAKDIKKIRLPQPDMELIHAEDAVTDQYKDVPWRFGVPIEADINLENAGSWESTKNGDRIWRLEIESQGAISLNLNYDRFRLPPGAKFFVYNPTKEHVLGAYTENNNRADGLFATNITKGDQVILEYFEPYRYSGQGDISIKSVVHGYRGIWEPQTFGQSGACNVNTNCAEGDGWEEQARSVVMVLSSSNSRRCSGAMINNAKNDGTPYMLTAAHCKTANVSIVMFNYDSPDCDPSKEGPTTDALLVEEVVSQNSFSDFMLALIEGPIPEEFNPYMAGWSIENIPSDTTVSIHHPSGDVKKISFEYDPIHLDTYLSQYEDTSHWRVDDWDVGTTEHRSSGAPLFDMNKRIIGQLHGGWAACNNEDADWYGTMYHNWATDADPAKQLKAWLDPDDSGVLTVDGYDPTVGIEDLSKAAFEVKLFPNPTAGKFEIRHLKLGEPNFHFQISIFNPLGEEVFQTTINGQRSTIDLSNQAKGMYFLSITQDGKQVTKKILLH